MSQRKLPDHIHAREIVLPSFARHVSEESISSDKIGNFTIIPSSLMYHLRIDVGTWNMTQIHFREDDS